MKRTYILITLFLINFQVAYSQESQLTLEDIFSGNMLYYQNKNIQMEENACIDYSNLYFAIPAFDSLSDTSIQRKINNFIENMMKGQLNNIEFRRKLSTHAIQAEIAYLQKQNNKSKQVVTCDINQSLYAPNITKVEYAFGVLNHDILPFAVTFTYSASVKNNFRLVALRYVELVYINIKTGKIYNSKEVFKPSSIATINDLIIKKYKKQDFLLKNREISHEKRNYYEDEEYEYVETEEEEDYLTFDVPVVKEIEDRNYDEVKIDMAETEMEYGDEEATVESVDEPVEAPEVQREEVYESRSSNRYDSYGRKNGSGYGTAGDGDGRGYSSNKEKIISPENERFYNSNGMYGLKLDLKEFSHEKNGLMTLNAISFSYVIAAFQPCHYLPFGKAAKIELTLEEIKQHINPNGPYSFLINYNQSSFVNQDVPIRELKTDVLTYEFIKYQQNIDLEVNSSVKRVEISVKNPNYLQTYRPSYKEKSIIDSVLYKVKYSRTYQNGLLISEKTMNLSHSKDTSFYETFYSYNKNGKLVLKIIKRYAYPIEKDTFIYDNNNNLLQSKHFVNGDFKFGQLLYYMNNLVFVELSNDHSEKPQILKYSFNKNKQLDTIFNYQVGIKKTFRYDSLGNPILVYSPKNSSCFQYLIYNSNKQISAIGNYGSSNILAFEYDKNSGKISQIKENSEWIQKYEYDNQNRLVKIMFLNPDYGRNYKHNNVLIQYFE